MEIYSFPFFNNRDCCILIDRVIFSNRGCFASWKRIKNFRFDLLIPVMSEKESKYPYIHQNIAYHQKVAYHKFILYVL